MVLGNKLQQWNSPLQKCCLENRGYSNAQALSKERFVVYRNVDETEYKNQEKALLSHRPSPDIKNPHHNNPDEEERRMKRYDKEIAVLILDLEKMERNFFVPINAHPL